jgi:hypothetical protein
VDSRAGPKIELIPTNKPESTVEPSIVTARRGVPPQIYNNPISVSALLRKQDYGVGYVTLTSVLKYFLLERGVGQ